MAWFDFLFVDSEKDAVLDWLVEHDNGDYHGFAMTYGYELNRIYYKETYSLDALKPAKVYKETIVENIEWQVRNGTLTPVAILTPVDLQGATIKKASLCNVACLEQMGLEIGHKVLICRCGMIIPKIVKDVDTGKYAEGYEF